MALIKFNQQGFDHLVFGILFIVLFGLAGAAVIVSHAATPSYYNFRLALNPAYCIDNYHNSSSASQVYLYPCNSSGKVDPGEEWRTYGSTARFELKSEAGTCISGINGVGTSGNRKPLVTAKCSGTEVQLWHRDATNSELINNANKGCINDPGKAQSSVQLILFSCGKSPSSNYQWGKVSPPAVTTSSSASTSSPPTSSGTSSASQGPNLTNISKCPLGYPCILYGDSISSDKNYTPGTPLLGSSSKPPYTSIEFQSDWNLVSYLDGTAVFASNTSVNHIGGNNGVIHDFVHLALQGNGDIVFWDKPYYDTTYTAKWALHSNYGTSVSCSGTKYTVNGYALVMSPLVSMELWAHTSANGGRWHIIFTPTSGLGCSHWDATNDSGLEGKG